MHLPEENKHIQSRYCPSFGHHLGSKSHIQSLGEVRCGVQFVILELTK